MLRGSVPSVQSRAVHTFSKSPQLHMSRSKFNRSHGVKTAFNEGYLVPVLCDEMVPGDTFSLRMHAFCRLASPLKYPIMDNMFLESFFFAIPYRLVWDHWEEFNGAYSGAGIQPVTYTIPVCSAPAVGGVATGDLQDYMGIPIKINSLIFDSLHQRAYNLIWNEWFRDENLQASVVVDLDDGPDTYSDYTLLRRGKRYDYFTSCLPWPQKGPDVELPLGTSAPVTLDGSAPYPAPLIRQASSGSLIGGGASLTSGAGGQFQTAGGTGDSVIDPNGSLIVDLSAATAATINDIRYAFQLQKLYERDARGGTRYTEIINAHFGVISPDMRLQRPEYVGGGSTPIMINPVAQTTQNTTPTIDNGLAALGAYGVAAAQGHGFTYSATEHMLVVGLVAVRADLNYQQGLERMWSRQYREDFYWPEFAHIGEQAVLNKEIFAQGSSADDDVFGYQERYAEYRYKPSQITGIFRSDATGTLDSWHLAQDFAALPTLGSTFIQENAPMSRVKLVSSAPDFLFDCFFDYTCVRPMPVYSIPGLIDHF